MQILIKAIAVFFTDPKTEHRKSTNQRGYSQYQYQYQYQYQ
jgi:hypothetical protein